MKEPTSIVDSMGNQRLIGFCKKCNDVVFLKESLKVLSDGQEQVKGSCCGCNGYVKFISHDESILYKSLNNGSHLEFIVTNGNLKKKVPPTTLRVIPRRKK